MKYRRHPYGKITSSCEKFKTRTQVTKIKLLEKIHALEIPVKEISFSS
jgi:hypothetical protein